MTIRIGKGAAALLAGAVSLALVGCADNDATAPEPAGSEGGGTVIAGQPDVNGDGKVLIGVLSPGDINDNGYYESFVAEAERFAGEQGWEVIKRGSVPPTEALSSARALCQQGVDMVALGASELKDAIPASEEPACENVAWYVPSSENIPQTPEIVISSDDPNQSMLAAGYATGLLMEENGDTKAGFVTGMEVDFAINAARAFKAGIRMVVPEAELVITYTGDFNDSAKAREAVQAQIDQGVSVVYPYLGGATDAAAELANEGGALTLTPGTDRCDSTEPEFDISVIFDPGAYFAAALTLFADGELEMGTTKVWQIGIDPYPAIKICDPTAEQTERMDAFVTDVAEGNIDTAAEVERLGG